MDSTVIELSLSFILFFLKQAERKLRNNNSNAIESNTLTLQETAMVMEGRGFQVFECRYNEYDCPL
jgi:hypothetical protein